MIEVAPWRSELGLSEVRRHELLEPLVCLLPHSWPLVVLTHTLVHLCLVLPLWILPLGRGQGSFKGRLVIRLKCLLKLQLSDSRHFIVLLYIHRLALLRELLTVLRHGGGGLLLVKEFWINDIGLVQVCWVLEGVLVDLVISD